MSFGYSVGDFIAAAGLVYKVVQSLRAAGGAKTTHRELCVDLEVLTATLRRVHSVELEGHRNETAHLRRECEACLKKIFEFGKKIHKFQSTLQNGGSGDPVLEVKKFWHKIEWGVLREDEVKDFKADLAVPLQKVAIEQKNLLLTQGNFVLGNQAEHSELLRQILDLVKQQHGQPPPYHEHTSEDVRPKPHERAGFRQALSYPPLPPSEIDNVLKELATIETRFATPQGNSDEQVIIVIKHTIAACEGLQGEAENLKWVTLSKVLENLAGILKKYDEDRFRSFPTKTKGFVVHVMRTTLERSLNFTDKTIALLREHQKESGPKSGHGGEDTQVSQYSRVGRCITNLAEVASQFDGFVSQSDKDTKPWLYEDFDFKIREDRQASNSSFSLTLSTTSTSSGEYDAPVTPPSYSDKFPTSFVKEVELGEADFPDPSKLFSACQERKIDLLKQLLPTQDINATDDNGRGVLHLALGSGKVNANKSKMTNITNTVRLLSRHGADVNAPDQSGLRPIHYCAQTINSEAAKCLLESGARINELDSKERTALNYTATDSHPDLEFVNMLVSKGAKLGPARLPKLPPRSNESQRKVRQLVMKL